MRRKPGPKAILGWSEYVELPDWGIVRLKAKVDTGARTSALHVDNLRRLPGGRVAFEVVLSRKNPDRRMLVEAAVVKRALVRSSTGHFTRRVFVRTTLRVAGISKEVEVSLVSREKMLFRMLLGRTALEHDFLVDVSHRAKPRSSPRKNPFKSETAAKTARKGSKAVKAAKAGKKKPQ